MNRQWDMIKGSLPTSMMKGSVATQLQLIIAMGDCGAEPPRPSELSREVRNLNYHATLFAFLKCWQPIKKHLKKKNYTGQGKHFFISYDLNFFLSLSWPIHSEKETEAQRVSVSEVTENKLNADLLILSLLLY